MYSWQLTDDLLWHTDEAFVNLEILIKPKKEKEHIWLHVSLTGMDLNLKKSSVIELEQSVPFGCKFQIGFMVKLKLAELITEEKAHARGMNSILLKTES